MTEERLAQIRGAAETLLSNPVIEDFTVRVEERAIRRSLLRHDPAGARDRVVTFPGSLDDADAAARSGWPAASRSRSGTRDADLHGVDAVVLPGGFSYGDYLRCGAIARFAPVMEPLVEAAHGGLPVLGICNGFQVLCESHLLPGALIRNDHRKFNCVDQELVVENTATVWTVGYAAGQRIVVPLKNGEGGYVADEKTLDGLEGEGRVVVRYAGGNPNGSYRDIAGISNERGNVVGLMPHPEHAVEDLTGPIDRRAGVLHLGAEGGRRRMSRDASSTPRRTPGASSSRGASSG